MQEREVAHRVFSGEYNRSTVRMNPEANRMPTYVLTELGRRINRLFVVGVLTDTEQINETKEIWRAHISDPTGIFTLYSGLYQPEVSLLLKEIETPVYLAAVGKVHTFEPEEGKTFVSVRPEKVKVVNEITRNHWILETYKQTKRRVEGLEETLKMNNPDSSSLIKLGYPRKMAEGAIDAIKSYGEIDLGYYNGMLEDAFSYLNQQIESSKSALSERKIEKETAKTLSTLEEEQKERDEAETKILEIIKGLETPQGVQWNSVIEQGAKGGLDKYAMEEAISSLMDKGIVYEPVLGWIKRT